MSIALESAHRLSENVTRATLENGLTVLVKENHNAPVVALLLSVRAGYFQEPDRWNGIAHVVEHMLFKGTEKRPDQEQIAREVRRLGGRINAGTYYEETYYYLTVPSEHLEAALEIQADALQNSRLDPEELTKEIEVIVQESLQKRDNPTAMLAETLYELAHDAHRIRRWRIGHPETLRAFRREDLQAFMEQVYRPENMTLAIVGDVASDRALALARDYWSRVPRGQLRRELSPTEPAREGFRYRRMTGNIRQRLLLFGFPVPSVLHPDAAPLMALSGYLSDGRSARLYRALREEKKLVNSVWASYEGFEQMGLFTFGAESIGDDLLPVEEALWQEITRIQAQGIETEALARVKTRIEMRRLSAQEEVLGVARTLVTYENLGDYRLLDELYGRLNQVTPEDVRRVAQTYFPLESASLLEYLPEGLDAPAPTAETVLERLNGAGGKRSSPDPRPLPQSREERGIRAARPAVHSASSLLAAKQPVQERNLPGGGRLLFRQRRDLPLVAIQALLPGGKRKETRRNCGVTNLLLKSSLKGTRSYTAEELAHRIERLGSGISMTLAADFFGYGIKLRKEALDEGVEIFAEVARQPAFPTEEVEREKQAIAAELRRQQDSNVSLASDLLAAVYFGEEHPYGLPSIAIREVVAALTPESLRAWHRRHLRPANLTVAVVGDLELEEALERIAGPLTAGLENLESETEDEESGKNVTSPGTALSRFPVAPAAERVIYRAKQQTAVALGFPGADVHHPDRHALDVLAEIASGMSGRFFRSVRGDNALAYQVSGFHRSRLEAGQFIAFTSTAPENEAQAVDLLLAECAKLGQEGVTPEELADAKNSLEGDYVIQLQTFGAQAGELAAIAAYGLSLDEPARYLARIQAVTPEEVQEAARRYLREEFCCRGIVRGGPEG